MYEDCNLLHILYEGNEDKLLYRGWRDQILNRAGYILTYSTLGYILSSTAEMINSTEMSKSYMLKDKLAYGYTNT